MSLFPLPDLILMNTHKGNWDFYQKVIYEEFLDSVDKKLKFLGLPIKCRYFEPINDMHRGFWHLITEDPQNSKNDEERLPDIRRCERMKWISHIINNINHPAILCWENKRGSNTNVVIWLEQENYMIVLSKRKDYYLLVTAYVHDKNKSIKNKKESNLYNDPRKGKVT